MIHISWFNEDGSLREQFSSNDRKEAANKLEEIMYKSLAEDKFAKRGGDIRDKYMKFYRDGKLDIEWTEDE